MMQDVERNMYYPYCALYCVFKMQNVFLLEKKGKKYKTSKLLNFFMSMYAILGAGTMILLSRFL